MGGPGKFRTRTSHQYGFKSSNHKVDRQADPRPINKEDYTGFALSSGWLFNLKMRNGLSSKKTKGDDGKVDEALLPGMRDELKEELEEYALRDVFNCDELALRYVFSNL